MKQIVQRARSGKLELLDVPAPSVHAGYLLVRTCASLISAGTERMAVSFARKSLVGKARERPDLVRKVLGKMRRDGIRATAQAVMSQLDEPLPLGYSAAGVVVEVGANVEGRFAPGARVAVAGAGLSNHAEFNVIPENLVVPVPADVSDEEACFGTLGAIALHSVRNLGLGLGDFAAVIGVGLVGQLAVRFLTLSGVRVLAFDYDPARLALAASGGAELAWNLADGSPAGALSVATLGRGCDGVLIAAATSSSEPFRLAAEIARDRGRVVLVGLTGTEIPYREFMHKELSLMVSRSYGPGRYDEDYEGRGMKYPPGYIPWTETRNLAESVRLMSRGSDRRLAVEALITHRIAFEQAETAYKLVTENVEPHLGVVLTYGEPHTTGRYAARLPMPQRRANNPGRCVLGVIGAGNFARATLLPTLRAIPECRLHTLVTRRSVSAAHSAERFGFEVAATEACAVLENAEINAVLIATPHGNHAQLASAALAAGKSVLVEKPLALDRAEVNAIAAARNGSSGFLQVGFNRRFAPMAQAAADRLHGVPGPRFVLMRINAGALADDSWQNAPEEGHGRILGELCHFVDLARFWVGAPIRSVQASAAAVLHGVCDDVAAALSFADGSLATLAYTSQGNTGFSKEYLEAYAGGMTIAIEDFRRLTVVSNGRTEHSASQVQDKGHEVQLAAFVAAVVAGGPAPVPEDEPLEVTRATIAILESLRTGSAAKP